MRGDSRDGSLNGDEIGIIAEKSFASLLGQPFVFAKIMTPKIADHDPTGSLVILFAAKRQCQIKVRKLCRPSRMGTIGFDDCKSAKSLIAVVSIFDLRPFSIALRYFDAPRLSREVLGLFGKRTVELG